MGYLLLIAVILSPFLAGIPAAIASGKGRDGFLWWLYGLVLFPVAFFHALLMPMDTAWAESRSLRAGSGKRCEHCDEMIRPRAAVCRYCGRDVSSVPPAVEPPIAATARVEPPPPVWSDRLSPVSRTRWAVGIAGATLAILILIAWSGLWRASPSATRVAAWPPAAEAPAIWRQCESGIEIAGRSAPWARDAKLISPPAAWQGTTSSAACVITGPAGESGHIMIDRACPVAGEGCSPVIYLMLGVRIWRPAP